MRNSWVPLRAAETVAAKPSKTVESFMAMFELRFVALRWRWEAFLSKSVGN